ncbi:uncharacterized protein [Embiotoca jacksoni]|uniref:uncharacterized protein n=1 Tax=Embiotoca jacksoni TaxID=100190 RepID=UPI003704C807
MDKEIKHGQAVMVTQLDCVESDTKSLTQKSAYKQQPQMYMSHCDETKFIQMQKESADGSLQDDRGNEHHADEDETEDLQVFNSLEVAAQPQAKKNPIVFQTEYLETQMYEKGTSQLLSDDAYSDLHYDPNWRINLKGAGRSNKSPRISVKKHYKNSKDISCQSCGDSEGQLRSPKADLSGAFSNTLQKGFRGKGVNACDNVSGNIGRPPELTDNIQAMHIQELNTYYQQEVRHKQGRTILRQKRSTSPLTSPKVFSNKNLGNQMEDIVERNRRTLGRNASKCGSYGKAHALGKEMPHNVKKVTQISKGKKAQQNKYLNPSQQEPPLALGVKAEHGDCRSTPIAKPQTSPDAIIKFSASEVAMPPGYQQTNPRRSTHISWDGLNTQYHQQQLDSTEQWQRTTALQRPLSCEEEDQKWSPNEVYMRQFVHDLTRTSTTASSQGSGFNTVLPPIGNQITGKRPELRHGRNVNTAYRMHRSKIAGLVQVEKQEQMRARVTYKAHSLKDYKQLKSDVKLQGLGRDYTAIENTVSICLYCQSVTYQLKKSFTRRPTPPSFVV